MHSTHRALFGAIVSTLVFSTLACGSPPPIEVAEAGASSDAAPMQPAHSTDTQPANVPEGHPSVDLPAGHPPTTGGVATPAGMLPAVAPDAGTGASGLTWDAPESWASLPPTNSMRRAQYQVDGPGGAGECVVYYFGPGQGGAPMANAERWADQFSGGTEMTTRTERIGGIDVLYVERTGTYQSGSMMGMGQGVAKPDWALLGAIAQGPDANWFFKFTGPKATVDAERGAFGQMIASVRTGG